MKVAILGLGSSIRDFEAADFDLSIGVNDIWRIVESDDIVCLNPPKDFTPDRLRVINNSKPQHFFSQMVVWDSRADFTKIDFRTGFPDRICRLDGTQYEKSFCSPFVAAQIAFKYYGANEIHLFGIDLINHPHLNQFLCAKIKIHFRNLAIALKEYNCKIIVNGNGILADIL